MTSKFGTPDIELKENSTRPVISDTILDENGNALDLSGATVKFLLERPDGQLAVNSAATITDAANGEVEYTLSTGETAATGRHLGEWRVEFSASNIRRHPVGSYLAIDIDRALGDLDAETIEDPDLTVTTLTADTVLADQVGTENNPASVTADSITDSDDGGAWETLREAGFESGDVFNITDVTGESDRSASVSSTTFQRFREMGSSFIHYDGFAPSNGTTVFALTGSMSAGTDETITIQLWNETDGEEITTISTTKSTGFEFVWSDWVQYTPTTTDSPVETMIRAKTDPGTNASDYSDVSGFMGVQL